VAQRVAVSGDVLYGPKGSPLAGHWVVLHEIQPHGRGGPIDSMRTGPGGRFTLTIPRVDTAAMYVASSWYEGIAYFSEPVPPGRSAVALQPIRVYDTASTGPPIRLDRRLVTVTHPAKDGTRSVLELLMVTNPGVATRVTNDTAKPTWAGALPHGVMQFQVGQGDLSGDAVGLRGDSVIVVGPIPPGDAKQLTYSYNLPATADGLALRIDQPTSEFDLLLEDTTTLVSAAGLEPGDVQVVDQRHFASYRGRDLGPPLTIALTFPRKGLRVESLEPYVVALVALALVAGLVVALKKKPSAVSRQPAAARRR